MLKSLICTANFQRVFSMVVTSLSALRKITGPARGLRELAGLSSQTFEIAIAGDKISKLDKVIQDLIPLLTPKDKKPEWAIGLQAICTRQVELLHACRHVCTEHMQAVFLELAASDLVDSVKDDQCVASVAYSAVVAKLLQVEPTFSDNADIQAAFANMRTIVAHIRELASMADWAKDTYHKQQEARKQEATGRPRKPHLFKTFSPGKLELPDLGLTSLTAQEGEIFFTRRRFSGFSVLATC